MGDLVSLLASAGTGAKRLVQVEFTSSTVWTVPSTVPVVFVTAVGGGGGGGCQSWFSGGYINYTVTSGGGGAILRQWPMTVKGTVSITIGAGGAGGTWSEYSSGYRYGTEGSPGGDTIINHITVGGGGNGRGISTSSSQINFGTIFDSLYYDSYNGTYDFRDMGSHASSRQPGLNISKANGVVALVSGSAGGVQWNGSSYYPSPATRIGQGGGVGQSYYYCPAAAGAAGYVMLEYFV